MNEIHWSDPYVKALEEKTYYAGESVHEVRPMFQLLDDICQRPEHLMEYESISRIRDNAIQGADIVVE